MEILWTSWSMEYQTADCFLPIPLNRNDPVCSALACKDRAAGFWWDHYAVSNASAFHKLVFEDRAVRANRADCEAKKAIRGRMESDYQHYAPASMEMCSDVLQPA